MLTLNQSTFCACLCRFNWGHSWSLHFCISNFSGHSQLSPQPQVDWMKTMLLSPCFLVGESTTDSFRTFCDAQNYHMFGVQSKAPQQYLCLTSYSVCLLSLCEDHKGSICVSIGNWCREDVGLTVYHPRRAICFTSAITQRLSLLIGVLPGNRWPAFNGSTLFSWNWST